MIQVRKGNPTGIFYLQVVKGSLRQCPLPDEETEAAEVWLGISNIGGRTQVSSPPYSPHHAVILFFLGFEEQGPLGSLLE